MLELCRCDIMLCMGLTPEQIERFWKKVCVGTVEECWLWTGRRNQHGYGLWTPTFRAKDLRAHRVSYELKVGPIPDGLFVCHRCDVRNCVNPIHLFVGTNTDNMLDKIQKGRDRGFAARNRTKTYCINGHPLEGTNLIERPGRRRCRICKSVARRSRYLRLGK